MANRENGNSHELSHLNPDNNESVPTSPTGMKNFRQFLLRLYQKQSFYKYCAIFSFILFLLLLVTVLLIYNYNFIIILKQKLHCPMDETKLAKRKSCSLVDDGHKYRYDQITEKCYQVESHGPCGENMLFAAKQNDPYLGTCRCNNQNGKRALIMDNEKRNCYYIFEKGPCAEGEWINLDDDKKLIEPSLICEESFCRNETHPNLVPLLIKDANGNDDFKCVILGEKSEYCPVPNEEYEIEFTSTCLFPKCVQKVNVQQIPTLKVGFSPGSTLFAKPPETPIIPPASGKLPSRRKGKVIG